MFWGQHSDRLNQCFSPEDDMLREKKAHWCRTNTHFARAGGSSGPAPPVLMQYLSSNAMCSMFQTVFSQPSGNGNRKYKS